MCVLHKKPFYKARWDQRVFLVDLWFQLFAFFVYNSGTDDMSLSPAEVSFGLWDHFSKVKNLAAIVISSLGILLEDTRGSVTSNHVVPDELFAKVWDSNWIFDEYGEVFSSFDQWPRFLIRIWILLYRTPGLDFADVLILLQPSKIEHRSWIWWKTVKYASSFSFSPGKSTRTRSYKKFQCKSTLDFATPKMFIR